MLRRYGQVTKKGKQMSERKALKYYFDLELAHRLSSLIKPYFPTFPTDLFVQSVALKTEPLELKGRVAVLADELRNTLPTDYSEALNILLRILGPENETEQGMFTNGYFLMPIAFLWKDMDYSILKFPCMQCMKLLSDILQNIPYALIWSAIQMNV